LSIGESDWVPLIAVGISVSGKNLAISSVDGRRPAHDGVGVGNEEDVESGLVVLQRALDRLGVVPGVDV